MKITKEQQTKAVELYLKDTSNTEIMAKLDLNKNQLQWLINRIQFKDELSTLRQQRIEKAYNMEANIFQMIAEGKSIKGYDSVFSSFCA